MQTIKYSPRFKKDLKRLRLSGWKMEPFEEFIRVLPFQWPLPQKFEAHPLHGEKAGMWDIHIRQNWVVFLRKDGDTITLIRTGTHASLGIG